ncbi:hypothetical protein E4U42_004909 [Claviceps africana]|uniref:Uncharacterized protein n=1 Tax=Claviceps africana TaxID=83212 RepID=A0A8K0J4J7_9HYPO|nr:hypothetical protein E4U42_004909 [Claviceps africana]
MGPRTKHCQLLPEADPLKLMAALGIKVHQQLTSKSMFVGCVLGDVNPALRSGTCERGDNPTDIDSCEAKRECEDERFPGRDEVWVGLGVDAGEEKSMHGT